VAEYKAFDRQLAVEASMQHSGSRTIQKTVESMFFVDLNEDAYTPMNIMAMVELSECSSICGGSILAESDPSIRDTCIAVAGLPSNSTVMVKKYCIPKAQGRGVASAATETWFIWYSEEWTDSLLELYFADTIYGDTLIAFRDNKGRGSESGPDEQIVSIHPRAIQAKPDAYYR
jgi:hypothetical protein